MKTMTCEQLGGACKMEFHASTFEKISEMSKNHGMEMYQKGDKAHIEAINRMQKLMHSRNAMNEWMKNKRKEFDDLPDTD